MFRQGGYRSLAALLAATHLLLAMQVPVAHAAMIGTDEVLQAGQSQVDRQRLLAMLDEQGVKERLAAMGVPRERVEQRIHSLTDSELAQFNRQLSEAPAGGFIGIIVLFLVIFIITDMLCATDVFTFVKCINRR